MKLSLDEMLTLTLEKGASDLHLKAGIIPVIRKHGKLRPLTSSALPLTSEDLEQIALSILDQRQRAQFLEKMDIDVSYGLSGVGRFRINILKQRGTYRLVIRAIPDTVRGIDELNLPPIVKKIAERERGLVLVTGATGSGKSSTLAAMIDHMNRTQSKHILTIEDPTEFLIKDRKCIITQRELGTDTISFASSLRAALRQDPDVILIGEMRDRETIEIALLAAETGHLVLSTLHTLDANETINRILAAFDSSHQNQIRLQLASVLSAIISQRMCSRMDDQGYYPALEVLINNARIAEIIADPTRHHEIRKVMEESQSVWGMCTFDQALMDLVSKEIISYDEALKSSTSPENFAIRYSGVSHMDGKNWGTSGMVKRHEKAWADLTAMELEKTMANDKPSTGKINETKKASGDIGNSGVRKRSK